MTELLGLSVEERIAKFIDVYQSLRKGSCERILSRRNLPLQAVHPFAGSLTIVDISSPDFWRIRLSGTKACARGGSDRTGSNALHCFSDDERALRSALAHSLFDTPCGVRATTRETYANGKDALLDTIALPLLGEDGQRLVVHYAEVMQDIEHGYGSRPLAERTGLVSYAHVDLGYGLPRDEDLRLSA